MTKDEFFNQLGMMLRDVPPGTTEDLSDFMVAYWDGREVMFAFLSDETGDLDEEFDLNDYEWAKRFPAFNSWVKAPVFSRRLQVMEWLKGAPPFEAGV